MKIIAAHFVTPANGEGGVVCSTNKTVTIAQLTDPATHSTFIVELDDGSTDVYCADRVSHDAFSGFIAHITERESK